MIAEELFIYLRSVFPGLVKDSLIRLYENVVKRAAELEANIRLSYTKYIFSKLSSTLVPPFEALTRKRASKFLLIDVQSRKTLKSDTPMTPNSHGYVGVPLLMMEPALHRVGKDGKLTELRRTKYLFEPYAPLPRQSRKAA